MRRPVDDVARGLGGDMAGTGTSSSTTFSMTLPVNFAADTITLPAVVTIVLRAAVLCLRKPFINVGFFVAFDDDFAAFCAEIDFRPDEDAATIV